MSPKKLLSPWERTKSIFIHTLFFNISNQSWLRDGIFSGSRIPIPNFYFGLDRKILKIPKSRGSGSRFENSEKIPKEKSKNPGDRDRDFKISKKSRKIRESGNRDWALKIPIKFLSPGFFTFGISRYFLSPGSGFLFVGWDIPTKSQLWF